MPKQRITKDMVVEAAFKIARQSGIEKVLVKKYCRRAGLFGTTNLQLLQEYGRSS